MASPESDYIFVDHEDCLPSKRDADPDLPHLPEISDFIDNQVAEALWPVNKAIHDNPELGYHEVIAHDALTSFIQSRSGWNVTRHAYGIKTAWTAVYDSGRPGPVVSLNAEMDALPIIGHACGHNLIASASVAAALATAHILSLSPSPLSNKIPGGAVLLIGTPAEEGGGGKIRLLKQGAYSSPPLNHPHLSPPSISLISHPGSIPATALVHTTAYSRFRVEYFGKEAHAAAEPWKGINALDALIIAYNSVSVLRQQTMPGDVIQGCITNGGARPNIIHAYAAGVFVIRARTRERLEELRKKVEACFEAGKMASGCEMALTRLGEYADHVPNRRLGGRYTAYWNRLVESDFADDGTKASQANEKEKWMPDKIPEDQDVDEMRGMSGASSDQGDVSYALPSLMPGFEIPTGEEGDVGPHNPGFARAAGTKEAYECTLRVGKALAGTAIDVLVRKDLLRDVEREFGNGPGKED
ncbi:peptidase M20 [Rhypophila decipiens]